MDKTEKLLQRIKTDLASGEQKRVRAGIGALASLAGRDQIPWHATSDVLYDEAHLSPDAPSQYAQAYREIFEVARRVKNPKYIEGLREIANIIEQNPQMMHPRHILDIAQDYYSDSSIAEYLRQGIIGSLGYAMRFFGESDYEEEIARRLNFKDKKSFGETAKFLELVPALYNVGDEYTYSDGENVVIDRVRNALAHAVQKREGSYLLHVRARLLLAQMDGRDHIDSGHDRRPFRFSGQQYGWHLRDGFHIAPIKDTERLDTLIGKLDRLERKITPPQHLVDAAIARGEREVMWQPDQKIMRERTLLYREIASHFTSKLMASDIFTGGKHPSDDDMRDYEYLLSRPTRETIETEFGFAISDLTPPEQFAFLSFIKTEDALGIENVQRFARAYGKDGLRAFLVMEHDRAFAHELIWNGNLLLEGVMTDGDPFFKEILAAYCRVLDAADIARDVYRNRWGKEMSEEEFEKVGAGLRERATLVLKKAVRGILGDTDKRPGGTEEVPTERIRKELERIETDIVATTVMARELKLDPATARGSSAGFIPSSALKGMVGKALAIQEAQYEKRPPSFRKTVSEALQKAFENPDTEFFTIQVPPDSAKLGEKDLAGLFRLDTVRNKAGEVDHLHFASMLLNPKYAGARMMANHAREALAERAQKTLIRAECFPKGADITHEYLEWGFVATGVTGALNMDLLQIEWDTARNRLLESTAVKMPKEEIIRRAGAVSPKKRSIGIRYGAHDAEPDFGTLFEPGFILTRYFKSSLGGKTRYYTVFEKDPLTEERPATRRRSSR